MMRIRHFLAAALAVASLALATLSPSMAQQASKPDSTQSTAVGALPPSYCPNITSQWYATGAVPSGYYKQSGAPYSCLPIPSCPGNQSFNTGAESCQCAAGTSWDSTYGTCHSPCGGGTAWNGSSCASICAAGTAWNGSSCASICAAGTSWNGSTCASICTGGQTWNGSACSCAAGSNWNGSSCVTCSAGTSWNGSSCASICTGGQSWNGSACACPGGQAWNGSTCGAGPAFTGFGISPANQTVGSSHTVSWSTSGSGNSVVLNCSGANSSSNSLSPAAGGSASLSAAVAGSTNCVATVSNSWGTANASASISASCPAGLTWNGSTCSCPAGTVFAAGSCGTPPSISSFSVSPSGVNVGTSYSFSWAASGTGVSLVLNCTGVNTAYYGLPSASGSGTLPTSAPGTTNCSITASSSWGSTSANVAGVTASCPGDTVWNGSTCAAAAPTLCGPTAKNYNAGPMQFFTTGGISNTDPTGVNSFRPGISCYQLGTNKLYVKLINPDGTDVAGTAAQIGMCEDISASQITCAGGGDTMLKWPVLDLPVGTTKHVIRSEQGYWVKRVDMCTVEMWGGGGSGNQTGSKAWGLGDGTSAATAQQSHRVFRICE